MVALPLEAETTAVNNSPTLRAVSSVSRIQERARALGQNKPQQQVFNQILLHELDAGSSIEGFGTGLTSEIISPQILPPQTAPQQASQASQVNQVKGAQDQAQPEEQEPGDFLNRSLGGISQGGSGRVKQRRVIEEEDSDSEEETDESESEEEEDSEEEDSEGTEEEDSEEEKVSIISKNSSVRSIFGPYEDELIKREYSNFGASIVVKADGWCWNSTKKNTRANIKPT